MPIVGGEKSNFPALVIHCAVLYFAEKMEAMSRPAKNPGQAGDEILLSPHQRSFCAWLSSSEAQELLGGSHSSAVAHRFSSV